jgi:hypothetical protein
LSSMTGFFRYKCNRSDALGEIMLRFLHAKRKALALITAPIEAQEVTIAFLRTHGTLHTFDKFCAVLQQDGRPVKCRLSAPAFASARGVPASVLYSIACPGTPHSLCPDGAF